MTCIICLLRTQAKLSKVSVQACVDRNCLDAVHCVCVHLAGSYHVSSKHLDEAADDADAAASDDNDDAAGLDAL